MMQIGDISVNKTNKKNFIEKDELDANNKLLKPKAED
jgi:hypothetical protein